MKNLILFVSVALVLLSACNSNSKPETIVPIFIDAMNNQDFETARKHATDGTLKFIDFLDEMAKLANEQGATFAEAAPASNVKCTIDGDKAQCTFCCVEGRGETEIELHFINGAWKVHVPFDGFDEESFDSLMDTTYNESDEFIEGEEEEEFYQRPNSF